MSGRTYLSIGDVLTLLREEFPDVTISKIRFLESQGLVNPERSPSGYRKFFEPDVERLRWVLRQQREHFLPLKVIRDRLSGGDLEEADLAGAETGAATVDPASETAGDQAGEPIRRNGKVPQPAHVGARHGTSEVSRIGGGISPGPSRTQEQIAQADDEAMARILADASRRAALIPETPGARPVLRAVPDEPAAETKPAAAGLEVATQPSGKGDAAKAAAATQNVGEAAGVRSTPPRVPDAPAAVPAPVPGEARHVASGVAATAALEAERVGNARRADRRGLGPRGSAQAPAGEAPPAAAAPVTGGATPRGTTVAATTDRAVPPPASAPWTPASSAMVTGASLTAEELCAASGLSEIELASLQGFGLIEAMEVAGIITFDENALTVANLAADFRKFGIEPRHLRLYRNAVDREMGLIEQVIIPLLRQRNPESRQRAVDSSVELGALGQAMRASLLRSALRRHVGG